MKDVEIKVNGDDFILVDAEGLSIDDEFMKYEPCTEGEMQTKKLISEAISKGVKNFHRTKCDPSFTEDGKGVCFVPGNMPAVDKDYNWWEKTAREYCPERNSRLGTRLQYGAFLGVLIKKLVAEGKSVKWAWNAVCNDSRELGHYRDSDGALHDFEPTGSREVCDYFDLANTVKILLEDDGFWLASGFYYIGSKFLPLASLGRHISHYDKYDFGVGWIVLDT